MAESGELDRLAEVVVCLSGRGDKDMPTVAEILESEGGAT